MSPQRLLHYTALILASIPFLLPFGPRPISLPRLSFSISMDANAQSNSKLPRTPSHDGLSLLACTFISHIARQTPCSIMHSPKTNDAFSSREARSLQNPTQTDTLLVFSTKSPPFIVEPCHRPRARAQTTAGTKATSRATNTDPGVRGALLPIIRRTSARSAGVP